MTVDELHKKYDWTEHCICSELDVEQGWADLKEFGNWLSQPHVDLKGEDTVEVQVYTRRYLGACFPDFEEILESIEERFENRDCLYGMDGEHLIEDAQGLEKFKAAYQEFRDAQLYFEASEEVEVCQFTVRELLDFCRQ